MTPAIHAVDFAAIFHRLLEAFGPRGWWPLSELRRRDPFTGGYHPGDYSPPASAAQRFEIGVGAILTQNTTWKQVAGCLDNLEQAGLMSLHELLRAPVETIEAAIRASGYYRQKARKLLEFARFFSEWDPQPPPRPKLLSVWGVGEETADSILLYAYGQPFFVVDAYSRRLVERLTGEVVSKYARLQERISAAFAHLEYACRVQVFNEFHALVVDLAKNHCRSRPRCRGCPLEDLCLIGKAGGVGTARF